MIISLLIFNYINLITCSPIQLRGIVEGFYGTPWTYEDRADLINFCGQQNLNAYIYAPKDDPFIEINDVYLILMIKFKKLKI